MFCPTCGTRATEGARFCHSCATALPTQSPNFSQPVTPLPAQPLSPSAQYPQPQINKGGQPTNVLGRLVLVGAVLIVLFVGGAIAIGVVKESSRSGQRSAFTNAANTIKEVVKTEYRDRIATENQIVQPGHFFSWTFSVTPDMLPARVEGSFAASGGSGNDILVYIVDEIGMVNVKNGHRTKLYYNSQQVTAGSINVELRPGKYYLVMDNTFSIISNKAVRSDINLVYHK